LSQILVEPKLQNVEQAKASEENLWLISPLTMPFKFLSEMD